MAGAKSIVLIGAGRMGAALATGWLSARNAPALSIIDPSPSDLVTDWAEAGKVSLNPAPAPAGTVVLAVKPQMFASVADSVKPFIGPKTLVISIMAGVRIGQMTDRLATQRVIRAMPNTPGAIGRGVTVFSTATGLTKADVEAAKRLLSPLGSVEGPVEEKYMSVVTGLSGSGPAYIYLLAEVMAEAGESEGLPRDLAERLAIQTVTGAAALMDQTGSKPVDLRKAVTSPGGTTQAALDILMDDGGMPILMRKAIRAAANRDRELSRDTD